LAVSSFILKPHLSPLYNVVALKKVSKVPVFEQHTYLLQVLSSYTIWSKYS